MVIPDEIEIFGHPLGPAELLAFAAAHPRETAAVVGLLVVISWVKLPRRTRRRIRRWAWRRVKASARWAQKRATSTGAPPPQRPSPRPADWRWPVEPGGPTVLYRHYDAADRLLYVGITDARRGGQRWHEHEADKPWFHLVARSEVSHPYPTRADALYAEALAIRDENPIHNICRPNPDLIGRA